jgi:hypothetical protein
MHICARFGPRRPRCHGLNSSRPHDPRTSPPKSVGVASHSPAFWGAWTNDSRKRRFPEWSCTQWPAP